MLSFLSIAVPRYFSAELFLNSQCQPVLLPGLFLPRCRTSQLSLRNSQTLQQLTAPVGPCASERELCPKHYQSLSNCWSSLHSFKKFQSRRIILPTEKITQDARNLLPLSQPAQSTLAIFCCFLLDLFIFFYQFSNCAVVTSVLTFLSSSVSSFPALQRAHQPGQNKEVQQGKRDLPAPQTRTVRWTTYRTTGPQKGAEH